MKFAKTILHKKTPEWADKYIDYKRLKKIISRRCALTTVVDGPGVTGGGVARLATPVHSGSGSGHDDEDNDDDDDHHPPCTVGGSPRRDSNRAALFVRDAGSQSPPLHRSAMPHSVSMPVTNADRRARRPFLHEDSSVSAGSVGDMASGERARSLSRDQPQPGSSSPRSRNGNGLLPLGADTVFARELQAELTKVCKFVDELEHEASLQKLRLQRIVQNGTTYDYDKRKLKTAFLQHYRYLELIKGFKTINRQGFLKIVKKYDKASGHHTLDYFTRNGLRATTLDHEEGIAELMADCVHQFSERFTQGQRRAALAFLRGPTSTPGDYHESPTYHAASAFNGCCLGAGVVLLIQSYLRHPPATDDQWLMEAAYLAMLAMMVASAMGQFVFDRVRINHHLILDYETPTQYLSWLQLLNFPCALLLVWAACRAAWGRVEELIIVQAVSLVVVFALPTALFHGEFRWWLVKRIGRIFAAPFFSVKFPDVFIADLMTSLSFSFGVVPLWGCTLHRWAAGAVADVDDDDHDSAPALCSKSSSVVALRLVFALSPYWIRILQCARRCHDSRAWAPQIYNLVKYLLQSVFLILAAFKLKSGTVWTLTCLVGTAASLYAYAWDVYMDWGLVRVIPVASRRPEPPIAPPDHPLDRLHRGPPLDADDTNPVHSDHDDHDDHDPIKSPGLASPHDPDSPASDHEHHDDEHESADALGEGPVRTSRFWWHAAVVPTAWLNRRRDAWWPVRAAAAWVVALWHRTLVLRHNRLFFSTRFYAVVVVVNLFARFSWTVTLIWPTMPARMVIAQAGIELTRRFLWMLLRLDNEQRHNCERLRATRESRLLVS
ncbi:hypothetical protein AMAG_00697 [Allomyces macrogynus ATCC 38327]|uniref:SPX domain-containing protein n=1 Tax=Allomyces macrogynus (strain ATCC 38327) TaxID=578462 RepID=A0A0L0RWK6_ALLM3|nr:hypothetical protein AMAG_00697 [Allomyces macrogynus ATCC 38327]|eukprot:KNE54738.1 hypothetical protein AMAG_00697 [Allomyces macrogynus ATCC 38327]